RQALGLRWIHASGVVADAYRSDGWTISEIENALCEFGSGIALEQHVDIVAKSQVLRALAHVETQLTLAPAGVARIELQNAILHLETRERRPQRLFVEYLDVQEPAPHQTLGCSRQTPGVRTVDSERSG